MPRTKEEFDKWFRDSGGDPWGYDGSFVRERLKSSLDFIKRHVPSSFSGLFVEIGAFNGDFTCMLANEFPASRILANDISEVALDQAQEKAGHFINVEFDLSDLASFRLRHGHDADQIVLVVMEALYYLPHGERSAALSRLLAELRSPLTFISGPIQGANYFNERRLTDMMKDNKFRCADISVLNYTDAFRDKLDHTSLRLGRALMLRRLNLDPGYRGKYGRQVIYCYKSTV